MRDLISGGGLAVVAVVYFLGARGLPAGQGEPGPGFFPVVLSSILFMLAVFIIVRGLKTTSGPDLPVARPAGLIFLTAAYAFGFGAVGFAISTLVYTAGVVWILGQRGVLVVVLPVVTTALVYCGFVLGLGVALP